MNEQAKLENLKEVLHQEDSLEEFRTKDVVYMDRQERRNRLKYFTKMFNKHIKTKPSVDIHEEDEVKQTAAIMRMQRWATRYAILARKIQELYEFKRDNTRDNKSTVGQSK